MALDWQPYARYWIHGHYAILMQAGRRESKERKTVRAKRPCRHQETRMYSRNIGTEEKILQTWNHRCGIKKKGVGRKKMSQTGLRK